MAAKGFDFRQPRFIAVLPLHRLEGKFGFMVKSRL
jgi:hypothetical protein